MDSNADGWPSIPRQSPTANEPTTTSQTPDVTQGGSSNACCRGSDCFEHGQALRSLEKDVRDAARAGQALLVRHEAYVAESETERSRLGSQVLRLENANQDLEAHNAHLLEENSSLLAQVDDMNNAVQQSDTQIQSLTATLHSTQRELEKVARLAARTETLEAQLLECEREQARLEATLTRSAEEERVALHKWRTSQRRVAELEAQMEDIEREARDERVRHEEVEARFDRRRAVEKELESSSSAHTGEAGDRRSSEVVSSFVKEILQDNANMQIAMVELQDLLAYYKETELMHGRLQQREIEDSDHSPYPSLSEELGVEAEEPQRQVHVHHHYHAPSAVSQRQSRSRSQQSQRPKRRRPLLVSGRSTPGHASQSPHRPSNARHKTTASTASSVGSFDSRISKQKRWSSQSAQSQSSFAISSGPSSPPSTSYCPSTIFERDLADRGTEYSRPTSPESNAVRSPSMTIHQKLPSIDSSFQPMSLPSRFAADDRRGSSLDRSGVSTIYESSQEQTTESVNGSSSLQQPVSGKTSSSPSKSSYAPPASPTRNHSPRRALRRTGSHASLVSISGMDIHSTIPTSPARSPFHDKTLNSRQQSGAVITAATASAIRAGQLNARGGMNQSLLRGRLDLTGPEGRNDQYAPLMDTFGKRLGGWLSQRWSSSDSKTNISNRTLGSSVGSSVKPSTTATEHIVASETAESGSNAAAGQARALPVDIPTAVPYKGGDAEKLSQSASPRRLKYRPPGINQAGGLPPLPSLGAFRSRTPITRMIDEKGLKELLEEDETPDLKRNIIPQQTPKHEDRSVPA